MTELTTIEANVLNIILPYRFDKPIKFEKSAGTNKVRQTDFTECTGNFEEERASSRQS
ncbi:hypothetical protein [Streptococcus suis]|uniref:hypothetical protein n=1 Tax=Streptococcus suis TaxID=1307 RepID=UPI001CF38F93|nr:hypothetical protein [Streptococcus suis]